MNEIQSTNQVSTQIIQGEDGKFKRVANYEAFTSVRPETREQKK